MMPTNHYTKRIELTPDDVIFATKIAKIRVSTKTTDGKFKSSKQSLYADQLLGVLGEVAITRIYGGVIDQTMRPYGDKHKPDVITADGTRVESKTITYLGNEPALKLFYSEVQEGVVYIMSQIYAWPDPPDSLPRGDGAGNT